MNKQIKWTQTLRTVLYARLVMEFGPHDAWGHQSYPDGCKDRYHEVLKELADYFEGITGKKFEWTAVQQQIDWAWTRQKGVKANHACLLYTSPSPRDRTRSRMPSSA